MCVFGFDVMVAGQALCPLGQCYRILGSDYLLPAQAKLYWVYVCYHVDGTFSRFLLKQAVLYCASVWVLPCGRDILPVVYGNMGCSILPVVYGNMGCSM